MELQTRSHCNSCRLSSICESQDEALQLQARHAGARQIELTGAAFSNVDPFFPVRVYHSSQSLEQPPIVFMLSQGLKSLS